jgi:type II restriction enzyme
MSSRDRLRKDRKGTVINLSSKKMESDLVVALIDAVEGVAKDFEVKLVHEKQVFLKDIVQHLRNAYPDIVFEYGLDTSSLLPDGGIVYLEAKDGDRHVVLISEAKRQGTNDAREAEGLKKQAKGNAIERLGKNVTGFRMWLSTEGIFPFVVFGQGVDFENGSSILDRVSTIAMFAPLNQIEVMNVGEEYRFNRGSFFFRSKNWKASEMEKVMREIMKRSIYYYFAKYGEDNFKD